LRRSGDSALQVVGDSVRDFVVCVWLMQTVSFSRSASDMIPRAISSVFSAIFAVFGMALITGLMSYAMKFAWLCVVAVISVPVATSIKDAINILMAIVAQMAIFVPMIGVTWARERELFRFWLSNEMEKA
jgi:hypothetical protein